MCLKCQLQVTGGLGIAMAVTSVLWNMLFNHYFEKFEAQHQLNAELLKSALYMQSVLKVA